jgi:ubiquinone/menaquinone biosynthesis C-methylase UbiE
LEAWRRGGIWLIKFPEVSLVVRGERMTDLREKVAREKAAYDGGSVHKESSALQSRFHHVFKCPNSRNAERYFDSIISKFAPDHDVLDYGCYNGWMVPRYLESEPRSITGIDISETAIKEAIATYGDSAKFWVGDAHAMPFPDESFDLVVGRAILHHLEWKLALQEIRRVLRPGGCAVFIEPLADNPFAKILRSLTPRARTLDEKPLSKSDIQYANKFFGGASHLYFNLISVPVSMATSLSSLNADNYLLQVTDWADRLLARTPARYWMRSVVLVWHRY